MSLLSLNNNQLEAFKKIIACYSSSTKYPEYGNWRKLTDNNIWLWMVNQIIVVGGSSGSKRFWQHKHLQKQVSLENLQKQKKEENIKKIINSTLLQAGVRYASKDAYACPKTNALFYNFKVLNELKTGITGLLHQLHSIDTELAEIDRVSYLMSNLKFMKNKSARDFLMNLGMNVNTLAIDIRTQNIFHHLKIGFPNTNQLSKAAVYSALESEIIGKVCKPLKILPMKFDRILYQNYFRIMSDDYKQLKLF